MKQIICMNWGVAYGPEYVNRLYNMARRNVTGPFRMVCLTDSVAGIRPEVECFECPTIAIPLPHCNTGWRKLTLWDHRVAGLEVGSEALFLDLDIVITDNIDGFFDYSSTDGSDFIVARNWTQPDRLVGNTSIYRFVVGKHPYLYHDFVAGHKQLLNEHANEQEYVSDIIAPGSMSFWPEEWCLSFKVNCVPKGVKRWFVEPTLPAGAKIVAFPGSPNPPDAAMGRWPSPWYKRFYKHIRPTRWVAQNWQ